MLGYLRYPQQLLCCLISFLNFSSFLSCNSGSIMERTSVQKCLCYFLCFTFTFYILFSGEKTSYPFFPYCWLLLFEFVWFGFKGDFTSHSWVKYCQDDFQTPSGTLPWPKSRLCPPLADIKHSYKNTDDTHKVQQSHHLKHNSLKSLFPDGFSSSPQTHEINGDASKTNLTNLNIQVCKKASLVVQVCSTYL